MDFGAALEGVRPWLSTVSLMGLLGLGARYWIVSRRLRITERDAASDGYAALLKQQENVIARSDLRIDSLEQAMVQERKVCAAEITVLRHRINNVSFSFDGLILLIEAAPEKAAESVAKIKEMRARQAAEESAEKAAVQAAILMANIPTKPAELTE